MWKVWMAGVMLVSMALSAQAAPVPVILDTDIGDDIDDTWALALLLNDPRIDLKLITVAFGDTPNKARLTAKMLETVGRTDVPLGIGPKTNDKKLNQDAWVGAYTLEQYKGKVLKDGVQALIDAINASPTPPVVCVIGPQTNLKAALEKAPDIAKKARIVTMAGGVYKGYDGGATPVPEWNVVCDIPAARALLAAPWEVTYAPLDSCGQIKVKGDKFKKLQASASPFAKLVMDNYAAWVNRANYPADSSSVLFDTLAVYLALDKELCEVKTINLSIDDQGKTVPDEKGRPAKVATVLKDPGAFEDWLVQGLTRTGK